MMGDEFNAATYFVDRQVLNGCAQRVAMECAEERVTYEQLRARVNQVGSALLHRLDVRMEERVLLLLQDVPEFAYSFFGAIKIGAVPVPVNTLLKPDEYEYLLNDCRARVVIVSASLLPALRQIPREKLPFLRHVVVCGGGDAGAIAFSDMVSAESSELDPAPTRKDDAAFWLYSSGSTGTPKGCVHLQHDMVVATDLYALGVLRIDREDRCFSAAKLFFAYGLGNALYFPLAVGATTILTPHSSSPQNVYAAIEKHKPTLFFSTPSNFAALLHVKREGAEFDLSSVRNAVSAGEPLPAALFHKFKDRFGVEILDGIGSTEALHIFISNRPGAIRPGSSGQIVPGCDCKVLDDDGQRVPRGELGTLWVKYDAVCSQYWNQHEKSKSTIQGPWICTGDKYREDEDGYFWYSGRSDDMLKVSGVWVSPAELEAVLVEHDAVVEAAVVAHKDGDDLVKPFAWIVLRDGITGDSDLARALQEYVATRLPAYKRPRWVEFVRELPKTATGKIQRFKLRETD